MIRASPLLPEIEGAGAANRSPEAMSDKSSFFAERIMSIGVRIF